MRGTTSATGDAGTPTTGGTPVTAPTGGARSPLPGIALTGAIAAASFALQALPGFSLLSPLILAIVIGVVLHNVVGTPAVALPGVKFSLRRLLRIGIVLLGLQLTLEQVLQVGLPGAAVVVTVLVATFVATTLLGRALGLRHELVELVAAGTSICGASAVIATNTVTRGRDEDVAYAIACVTVFGTISMLAYPVVGAALGLGDHAYGLWAGATIHEVAQVVASSYQHGEEAGHFGTIAKLTRVMMLAPMVLLLGAMTRRRRTREAGTTGDAGSAGEGVPIPWFVLGFVGMVVVASTGVLPAPVLEPVAVATRFLLAMALAAMGLETDLRKLAAMGVRPLILGASSWLFITLFGLILVMLPIAY